LTLISDVFAMDGDTESARTLAAEGIKRGADPSMLLLTVARMAQAAGKIEEAHVILQDLLQRKPYSFDGQYQLGVVYLRERNFPRAALTLKEAARLRPTSADAFFMLGQAEESQYHYSEADKAYTRAVQFAPENDGFRERYETFLKKLQTNKETSQEDVTESSDSEEHSSSSSP